MALPEAQGEKREIRALPEPAVVHTVRLARLAPTTPSVGEGVISTESPVLEMGPPGLTSGGEETWLPGARKQPANPWTYGRATPIRTRREAGDLRPPTSSPPGCSPTSATPCTTRNRPRIPCRRARQTFKAETRPHPAAGGHPQCIRSSLVSKPQGSAYVQIDPIHDAPENPSANGRRDETPQLQSECQSNRPTQFGLGRTAIP